MMNQGLFFILSAQQPTLLASWIHTLEKDSWMQSSGGHDEIRMLIYLKTIINIVVRRIGSLSLPASLPFYCSTSIRKQLIVKILKTLLVKVSLDLY